MEIKNDKIQDGPNEVIGYSFYYDNSFKFRIADKDFNNMLNSYKGKYQLLLAPLTSKIAFEGTTIEENVKTITVTDKGISIVKKLSEKLSMNLDTSKEINLEIICKDKVFLSLPWEFLFDDSDYLTKKIYIQRAQNIDATKSVVKFTKDHLLFAVAQCKLSDYDNDSTDHEKLPPCSIDSADHAKMIPIYYQGKITENCFSSFTFLRHLNCAALSESISKYKVIHLNCHGIGDGKQLCFESAEDYNSPEEIDLDKFKELIKAAKKVQLLFIYSCKMDKFREEGSFLAKIFGSFPNMEVIGMQYNIGAGSSNDDLGFIEKFYIALFANKNVFESFREALSHLRGSPKSMVFSPIFYSNYDYKNIHE
ncbi:MAG: CHAT domain-containing protein [Candidatus Paceibacterota bacterium]